jgi:hypothetical protein
VPASSCASGDDLGVAGPNAERIAIADTETVIPGLFDLHAHYAVELFGAGRKDETPAYPSLFLANGVTATFPAGEMDPNVMHDLRVRIENGQEPGPRLLNSGPYGLRLRVSVARRVERAGNPRRSCRAYGTNLRSRSISCWAKYVYSSAVVCTCCAMFAPEPCPPSITSKK